MKFWKNTPSKVETLLESDEIKKPVSGIFYRHLKRVVSEHREKLAPFSQVAKKLYRNRGWAKRKTFLDSSNFYAVFSYTDFLAKKGLFSLFYKNQVGKDFETGKTVLVTTGMRKFWGLQANLDEKRKIGNWMFPLRKSTKKIEQPSRPVLTMLSESDELVSDVERVVTNFVEDKIFFKE